MKKGKKDQADSTKFTVTIDKAVPTGPYDVRVVGSKGISNPRVFVVSDGEEVAEKEPNNDVEQAQKVTLGMTINGAISSPTDVDYFEINAKTGQRILFHAATASLDSKLHPEMRVFDAAGRQIAYSRPLPYQDGLLDFTAPADATYWLRLNQFTYVAGGTDYFYRLHIGTSAPGSTRFIPQRCRPASRRRSRSMAETFRAASKTRPRSSTASSSTR